MNKYKILINIINNYDPNIKTIYGYPFEVYNSTLNKNKQHFIIEWDIYNKNVIGYGLIPKNLIYKTSIDKQKFIYKYKYYLNNSEIIYLKDLNKNGSSLLLEYFNKKFKDIDFTTIPTNSIVDENNELTKDILNYDKNSETDLLNTLIKNLKNQFNYKYENKIIFEDMNLNPASKRGKDEKINIEKLHYHINNNTPSGQKIREEFSKTFPNKDKIKSSISDGADRKTHFDLKILLENSEKEETVEVKHSKDHKSIDNNKQPWSNGVQFLNGPGNKFTIANKYAENFYNKYISSSIISSHLNINTDIPSYDEWKKDAFKQGKPTTNYVKELREKGYRSSYLSNTRKHFNKDFNITEEDLNVLMYEVQDIIDNTFKCKDYWLQIQGDIDNPEKFNVRWSPKIESPTISNVEIIDSKSNCDINFKFTCDCGFIFTAKLRWGYGQCITNIRIDLK